jgi:hypothetical protein
LRNVFDQYSQPENKLTHALVTTLSEGVELLVPFVEWLGVLDCPKPGRIQIVEQSLPGEYSGGDEDDAERRGLPDAVIFDLDGGWALAIESKVQAKVSRDQIDRHQATLRRCGFDNVNVVALATEAPAGVAWRPWREVYAWFRSKVQVSAWSRRLTEYMEVFEATAASKNYEIRGTITMFDGIRFDDEHPYSWREAKRLIRLLGDELQGRRDLFALGVNPSGGRRGSITGKARDRIWDFLPLRSLAEGRAFTSSPHLTMAIGTEYAEAAITIPDGVKGGLKTKLSDLGRDGFRQMLDEICSRLDHVVLKSRGSKPIVYAVQKHYPSRSSAAVEDTRLEVDLDTISGSVARKVKAQPEWADALYHVLVNKNSNMQWGVGVRFSYDCPLVGSVACTDLFAEAWIASKPVLDLVLGR